MFQYILTLDVSQNYFRRAVAQRCPEPRMNNLISLSGQHQGREKNVSHHKVASALTKNFSLFRCFWNTELSSYNDKMQLDPKNVERGSLLEVRTDQAIAIEFKDKP